LFQSEKPEFFYLDDACENVYMSHSITTGISEVPVAYKFGVEDYPRFDLTDLRSAHFEFGKSPICKIQDHQLLCTSLNKFNSLQFQGFGPMDFNRSMKGNTEIKTSEIIDFGLSHNTLLINVFQVTNGKIKIIVTPINSERKIKQHRIEEVTMLTFDFPNIYMLRGQRELIIYNITYKTSHLLCINSPVFNISKDTKGYGEYSYN
jgi:hypothetical protein